MYIKKSSVELTTPTTIIGQSQIQSNFRAKQKHIMRTSQEVGVVGSAEYGMPGRLHVFGVKEGMKSWHEVFETIQEMSEWLRRHPTYKVYSRWMSIL